MGLLDKTNIKETNKRESASSSGMQILLFDNYNDEFMYCDAYPENVYDVKVNTPKGKMNKKWVIVNKNEVIPSIKAIKESMAEGAKINVIDVDTSKFRTVKDFLDYSVNEQPTLGASSKIIYIKFESDDGLDIITK